MFPSDAKIISKSKNHIKPCICLSFCNAYLANSIQIIQINLLKRDYREVLSTNFVFLKQEMHTSYILLQIQKCKFIWTFKCILEAIYRNTSVPIALFAYNSLSAKIKDYTIDMIKSMNCIRIKTHILISVSNSQPKIKWSY